MGLLLSIFVVCVGVIEALSCYQHFQYGVLRYATNLYENARKRNSVFLNYKSRRSKLKSEISIEEGDEKPKEPPPRFSEEFEAIIKDIAKSQELHLLQLQQQHLQLQLQIARLKEEKKEEDELLKQKKDKESNEKEKETKEIEIPKKFGKEEKTDLVKKLLNKAPKATRSISMPEQTLSKKDLEIAKIIDDLAIEPIDEIDIPVNVLDSEIITKEFDKIFDESEGVLKATKRLIEKRPSLTEIAFMTESAEGKVFDATKHDFAAQTVETSELEKPVEKKQFEEATLNQEVFFAQKALMADSSVQKDLETVPHLDKSTSVDLNEWSPTVVNQCTYMDFDAISKSASTTTSEDLIPISKSTSMDFETLNPVTKSTSTDFEMLNPISKSTSTNFDNAIPLNKSTSIDYEDLNPVSKSTSMTFDDLIPISKSTSMDFENIKKSTSTETPALIPVEKSTSMDFSNLIPINKSTSMDFENFVPVNKSTSMDFGNVLKDSSTQMNFLGRNSSTDLEDFYSVSESEDEETIHIELKTDEDKKRRKVPKNNSSLREKDLKNLNEGKNETVIPLDADTSVDDNNNNDGIGPKQNEPFQKTDVSKGKKIKTDENSIGKIVSKNVEGQAILMKNQSGQESDKSDSTLSEDSSGSMKKSKQEGKQEAFWLIFSGEYTKAMSKDWHSGHFSCWQCDEALTGQRYVLRDDHPYCIKCYESVFANVCEECNKIIGIDSKDLSYKDKHWHEACFLCNKCRVSLVDKQFGSKADKIYCGNCYDAQFASRCDGCGEIFRAGTKKMEYKTRQWHEKCFCCCVCKTPIGTKSFIPREQEIYCATCYEEKFATRCVKCNKIITSGGVTYKNEPWHRECFTCTNCDTSLAGQRFTSRDEKPYCADCFGELFAKRCTACSRPITGIGGTRFISFEDRHWHNDCFICASCKTSLVGRGFITDGDDIICPECAKQKLM